MKRLLQRLVAALIARAARTPYLHLYHADGTAYMRRFWLLRTRFLSIKLHHICTPDYDRHMHDHPWSFISVVLRGWYVERRPEFAAPTFTLEGREFFYPVARRAGAIGFRKAGDRHLVSEVSPGGVWTLFIHFAKARSWGFHTEEGWVHSREYASVHDAVDVRGDRRERELELA